MATDLALAISIGASAGAAMSVFSNLQGRMQAVAAVTADIKAKQNALSKEIKVAATTPRPDIDELNARFEKQKLILDKLRASTRDLGRIQSRIAANEAKRAQLRGKIVETAGLAYLAVQPLKVAIDAEEAMADVKKVVDERVPELEQYMLDASRRIPKSFEGLARIASSGAQGGIRRDDLEGYVDLVSKMAVAGDLSDDFAGESVAKIKNIFGTNMARMGELSDVINNLSNRESAKFSQIIDVMKRSGSTARLYGFTENQTAGLATAFLALGKTEETAGTAINAVLLKLQAADVQNTKFQVGLEKMGLSAEDLKKSIGQDAQGALTMFLERVKALPKADQMGALSQMFGLQYADEVALLANNLDVYKRAMTEATDAAQYAGSMEKEFAARSDTTANTLLLLKNDLTVISIQLGKVMLPALRDLVEAIRPWLDGLAQCVKAHPVIVSGALKLVAGLLTMKIVLLALAYAASLAVTPFLHLAKIWEMGKAGMLLYQSAGGGFINGMKTAFPLFGKLATGVSWALVKLKALGLMLDAGLVRVVKMAGGVLGKLGGVIVKLAGVMGQAFSWLSVALGKLGGIIVKSVMVIGQAFLWLGRALFLNPIGLIITGIAVAAFLIYKYWAPVQAFCIRFSGIIGDMLDGTLAFFSEWGKGIQGGFLLLCDQLAGFARNAWETLTAFFTSGIGNISATILDWSPLGLFYQAFAGVLSWFGVELPGQFSEFGSMIINGLISGITSKFGALKDSLSSVIGDTVGWAREKLGINSPSRVFAQIGGFTMEGLNEGLMANFKGPLETIKTVAAQLATAGAVALTPVMAPTVQAAGMDEGLMANHQIPVTCYLNPDLQRPLESIKTLAAQLAATGEITLSPVMASESMRVVAELQPMTAHEMPAEPLPPIGRQATAGQVSDIRYQESKPVAGQTFVQITVNPAPGMDEKALAELVAKKIRETQLSVAARARSRLTDSD